jgi:hypothetical protein
MSKRTISLTTTFVCLAFVLLACGQQNSSDKLGTKVDHTQWVVKYGKEFWRNPAPNIEPAQQKSPVAVSPEINIGDAIERVSHAIEIESPSIGKLSTRTYQAEFDENGMSLGLVSSPDTKITFRTLEISRGDVVHHQSDSEPISFWFAGNTAQTLLNQASGLVEHHETRTEGVKVTWMLPSQPEGQGSLIIEAEVLGLSYANEFGKSKITVGPTDVIDSVGRKWTVESVVDGDALLIEVPADVLDQAVYPLAVDPIIGPEFGLGETVAVTAAQSSSRNLAVAAGNDYFLILWQARPGMRVTRVGFDGSLLDPYGLGSIYGRPREYECAELSFDGEYFLAVWGGNGRSPGGSEDPVTYNIYGARIRASDGAVMDPVRFPIYTEIEDQTTPVVASNGNVFLVAWKDCHNTNSSCSPKSIKAVRVRGSDGAVLDNEPIEFASDEIDQLYPAIASNGDDFLLVWQSELGISGARVRGSDGLVIDSPANLLVPGGRSVALGSNGSDYYLAWNVDNLYGSRIRSSDGTLIDSPATQLAPGYGGPRVSSTGGDYFVAWHKDNFIKGRRVSGADGSLIDPDVITFSEMEEPPYLRTPRVAGKGGYYFVTWEESTYEYSTSWTTIFGTRVRAADGSILDAPGLLMSSRKNEQVYPSVASNGSSFFVVWGEEDLVDPRRWYLTVVGARIDASDGTILDPTGITIAESVEYYRGQSVASDGDDYFVVWDADLDANGIYGTRISGQDGSVLDPDYICVNSDEGFAPNIASNGDVYLVTWLIGCCNPWQAEGVRIRASDGVLLDQESIQIFQDFHLEPGSRYVASNGEDFLVVWSYLWEILGVRIRGSDGVVLDTENIVVGEADTEWSIPAVTSDGDGYLVTWLNSIHSDPVHEIHGARLVGESGEVLDPAGFLIGQSDRHIAPVVSFGTDSYLVVWKNRGNGASYDLHGARVAASDATVLDPESFLIASPAGRDEDHLYPSLAFDGSRFLLAYHRYDYGGIRVFARFVDVGECTIDGQTYQAGDLNPDNSCLECIPHLSEIEWNADDSNTCNEDLYCRSGDTCQQGVCTGGSERDCSSIVTDAQCQQAMCDEVYNRCYPQNLVEGTNCDDGLFCTDSDVCRSGHCESGIERDCSAGITEAQCQSASCDEDQDRCLINSTNEGLACDDGVFCTEGEVCQSGECEAGVARDCSAVVTDSQCQQARCDEDGGRCTFDLIDDGTECEDGLYCTVEDSCQSGTCTGGLTRDCSEVVTDSQCQYASCDEDSDQCLAVAAVDGKSCDDGDMCTRNDNCQAGVCQGTGRACTTDGGGCACGTPGSSQGPITLLFFLLLGLAVFYRRSS